MVMFNSSVRAEPVEALLFSLFPRVKKKDGPSTGSGRTVMVLMLVATLSACKPADAPKADTPNIAQDGGPPPPPPYQMRDEMPSGDRLAGHKDGATLFSNRCGACHLAGGMGTNLLTKQRMAMGETPDKGLLTNRSDMTPDYVKTVVRTGKNAMPPQTRVDMTDAELDAVATYLGKAKG